MRISRLLTSGLLILTCLRSGAAQNLSRPTTMKSGVPTISAMMYGLALSLSPMNTAQLTAARTPAAQALPVLPPQAVPNVAAAVPLVQPAPQAEEHRPSAFASLQAAVHNLFHPNPAAAPEQSAVLQASFDGTAPASQGQAVPGWSTALDAVRSSPPGMTPHSHVPTAILPDGTPIPPDSFTGGYHGTEIPPQKVVKDGGFQARGPQEDWRLQEHSEGASDPKSAFRGTTPFPAMPGAEVGAAYWAGEGGWVYKIVGVPTWGVDADLDGRVRKPDGSYRGSLMHESEDAIPARAPLECIEGWGQVSAWGDKLVMRPRDWVPNPRYNAADCKRFWGAAAQAAGAAN